jgi:cytochrome P450
MWRKLGGKLTMAQVIDAVNKYKLWDSSMRRNPQAVYAQMREHDPVYAATGPVTGNRFWFFTRYHDVQAVLKDPRFGKDTARLPEEIGRKYMPAESDPIFDAVNRHMLNLDPPDHTRLRALVHKAFTPRVIEELRPRIAQIAHDLLEEMAASSEANLIEVFAFPLPITVIAELLGIPAADQDKFRKWTKALLESADESESRESAMEFGMYMNALADERHANPRSDILSNLVHAEEQGDRLDRMELLSMLFLLLVAGHETTVNLIGNGMLALLTHPDQHTKLRDNPALISTAVEEMLRYNGPVETPTLRFAMEDVDWDGHRICAGDILLPSLLGANRDPTVFPDPDRFDITRNPNPHVAFGYGIHFCLGAPLARMEGAIAINALLARFPNLRLNADPDTLEWSDQLLIHGLKMLPVSW